MIKLFIFIFNILISTVYTLISIFVFLVVQILAIVSPAVIGILIAIPIYPVAKLPAAGLGIGGVIMSAVIFFNSFRTFKLDESFFGFNIRGFPKLKNLKVMVDKICKDVGVSRFQNIYLNTDVDIATLYTSRGRHLILGILPLKYFSSNELAAIIAHECAHHHHGQMLLSKIHYQAIMLFETFHMAFKHAISKAKKISNEPGFAIFGAGANISIFVIVVYHTIFRWFLSLMTLLINNPGYEYYCDSIAISYKGSQVFKSALQKAHDLQLTEAIVTEKYSKKNSRYLDNFEQEYTSLRMTNPPFRIHTGAIGTKTHPPLKSRLGRANIRDDAVEPDNSKPIFTNTEAVEWWNVCISQLELEKQKPKNKNTVNPDSTHETLILKKIEENYNIKLMELAIEKINSTDEKRKTLDTKKQTLELRMFEDKARILEGYREEYKHFKKKYWSIISIAFLGIFLSITITPLLSKIFSLPSYISIFLGLFFFFGSQFYLIWRMRNLRKKRALREQEIQINYGKVERLLDDVIFQIQKYKYDCKVNESKTKILNELNYMKIRQKIGLKEICITLSILALSISFFIFIDQLRGLMLKTLFEHTFHLFGTFSFFSIPFTGVLLIVLLITYIRRYFHYSKLKQILRIRLIETM